MAARLGESRAASGAAIVALWRYFDGVCDEECLQPSSAARRERQTSWQQTHCTPVRHHRAYRLQMVPSLPKCSRTASMCASLPLLTPTRAMSKPCTASRKMSSSISKTSLAGETFLPKPTPISSTSTSSGRTPTKKTRAPGKSSSDSLLAPRSPLELCLLPPVFLDYCLNDSGRYDVPRLPYSLKWRVC